MAHDSEMIKMLTKPDLSEPVQDPVVKQEPEQSPEPVVKQEQEPKKAGPFFDSQARKVPTNFGNWNSLHS